MSKSARNQLRKRGEINADLSFYGSKTAIKHGLQTHEQGNSLTVESLYIIILLSAAFRMSETSTRNQLP